MIGVGGIVVRRKSSRENATGAVADLPQEVGLGAAAAPVFKHSYPTAVGEAKAQYVDRVRGRMFAVGAFRSAVQAAAAVAARMIDRGDTAAEVAERSLLNDVRFEEVHPRCDRAARHQASRTKIDRLGTEPHAVFVAAFGSIAAGRDGDVVGACVPQECAALVRVVPQGGELRRREPADRMTQVKLRPGEVLGVLPDIIAREKIAAAK